MIYAVGGDANGFYFYSLINQNFDFKILIISHNLRCWRRRQQQQGKQSDIFGLFLISESTIQIHPSAFTFSFFLFFNARILVCFEPGRCNK